MARQKLSVNVTTQVPSVTVEDLELTTLADRINRWHEEIGQLQRQRLLRALAIGYALEQAKEQLPHGELEAWVTTNTTIKPVTAREYRLLWERRAEMFAAINLEPVDDAYLLPAMAKEQTANALAVLPDVSIRQAITATRKRLKAENPTSGSRYGTSAKVIVGRLLAQYDEDTLQEVVQLLQQALG
jgi:hypothetical protein